MHRSSIFFLIVAFLSIMLAACIKLYEPVIEQKDAIKYVISGQVSNGESVQIINVSVTSPIGKPRFLPVTGCSVTVFDDKGNSYIAADVGKGDYQCVIPENMLVPGNSFKVEVMLPGGTLIISDFDQIQFCPELDTVYYSVKELPTNNPEVFIKGIQFYVDLNAEESPSRNFRWEAIETWEYHSTWPREWYYDGHIHHIWPPDYSRFICWKTESVKNVFTLSTQNLQQNAYRLFPLHYVDNFNTSRLVYGYSLLVKQYALSEAAYAYWDKLRINSNMQGGLYEKQPLAIRGNMHNMTDPDQEVLGFFGASAVNSKRIFVNNVPGLSIDYTPNCVPSEGLRKGFADIDPINYPTYMFGDFYGFVMRTLDTECVDCLSVGGTNVKPAFWPN